MYAEVYTTNIDARCASAEMRAIFRIYAKDVGASFEDFFDALPAEYVPHLAIVVSESPGDFFYKHYGQSIATVTGFDMTGKRSSDFDSEVGRFFTRIYAQALTERRPIFTLHRASHALNVHVWERLILPMSARNGDDIFVTVIIPREFKAEFLQAVLASSPDAIVAMRSLRDIDGRVFDAVILAANDRFARSTGQSAEQLEGRRLLEVMPGHKQSGLWDKYVQVIETRQADIIETEYRHDGLEGWFRISVMPLGDGLNVCFTDITTLKAAVANAQAALRDAEAAREELRRQSFIDHLTGIFNRRGFDAQVRSFHVEQSRHGTPYVIIAIDVDFFKQVNDQHGHAVGDAVLVGITSVLLDETRADLDVIGRIGGEEFMVAMPHTTLPVAASSAERIRQKLECTAFCHGPDKISVTASFGVRQVRKGDALDDVLVGADKALYRAKRSGRNVVISAETDLSA